MSSKTILEERLRKGLPLNKDEFPRRTAAPRGLYGMPNLLPNGYSVSQYDLNDDDYYNRPNWKDEPFESYDRPRGHISAFDKDGNGNPYPHTLNRGSFEEQREPPAMSEAAKKRLWAMNKEDLYEDSDKGIKMSAYKEPENPFEAMSKEYDQVSVAVSALETLIKDRESKNENEVLERMLKKYRIKQNELKRTLQRFQNGKSLEVQLQHNNFCFCPSCGELLANYSTWTYCVNGCIALSTRDGSGFEYPVFLQSKQPKPATDILGPKEIP
jgi:hypothetical protein